MKTGTASLPAREPAQVDFSFKVSSIILILSVGLVVRLFLATYPGFVNDVATFQAWGKDLAAHWPWNFYNKGSFVDWTPGYLYVLWLLGLLDKLFTFNGDQFNYLLKLPAIAADLASVYLLYKLLEGQKVTVRVGAAALYAFHPALLIVGPVWAQVDSLLAFFLLLTVYYYARGRIVLGTMVYVIGFLTKPQAVAALPFLAFWVLREQYLQARADTPSMSDPVQRAVELAKRLAERLWRVVLAGFATTLAILLPFFPDNPWGVFDQLKSATEVYPYSTFWAYNFWGMLWAERAQFPQFPRDDLTYLGLDYRTWGLALFAISILAIIFVFRKARGPGMLALATSLSVLAFFVFLTRMHERYLFPFLLLFLAAAALTRSRFLWASFAVLSIIHFLNLYYVYSYYNPNSLRVDFIFDWSGKQDTIFWFSLITFLAVPVLVLASAFLPSGEAEEPEPT
ncbi:MAG: hypothetical protein HYY03_07310 [Chloroflexi bacterium]|nr:hypothetical protein [Chloroflexota bacterium]